MHFTSDLSGSEFDGRLSLQGLRLPDDEMKSEGPKLSQKQTPAFGNTNGQNAANPGLRDGKS